MEIHSTNLPGLLVMVSTRNRAPARARVLGCISNLETCQLRHSYMHRFSKPRLLCEMSILNKEERRPHVGVHDSLGLRCLNSARRRCKLGNYDCLDIKALLRCVSVSRSTEAFNSLQIDRTDRRQETSLDLHYTR